MSRTLTLVDVEVAGEPGATATIEGGRIRAIEFGGSAGRQRSRRSRRSEEDVVDGHGGALIRGLHDHHLHLMSMAARRASVPLGPPEVTDPAGLVTALHRAIENIEAGGGIEAGGEAWVRGYGYDESVAGPLTASVLDALLGARSGALVRVQHRSGHAWILNGAAVRHLGVDRLAHPGVERTAGGEPTGVLYELDGWLRDRIDAGLPSLGPVSETLAACGVTGLTDASPDNGPEALAAMTAARASGELLQRVHLLGADHLPAPDEAVGRRDGMSTGQVKIMLIDRALPSFDELVDRIVRAGGRGVAIHCVTRESLVLATTALAAAGPGPHRLEHASVAPPDVVELIARLGVAVVTQPAFVFEHGDRYLRDVEIADRAWLYRLRGWMDAGVPLRAGSDAPFGPADPWVGIRGAVERRTAAGGLLGPGERLSPELALGLYHGPLGGTGMDRTGMDRTGMDRTGNSGRPGGRPAVAVGDPADLCLLGVPWHVARHQLDSSFVEATVVDGRVVWQRGAR